MAGWINMLLREILVGLACDLIIQKVKTMREQINIIIKNPVNGIVFLMNLMIFQIGGQTIPFGRRVQFDFLRTTQLAY